MNLFLLVVAFGLAGASPLEDSKVCQPHSRPWQVYLHGGEGMSCSGALINEWWIVTSLNCAPTSYSTIASLGEHDMKVEEGTEQHIYVADVIIHDPYRTSLHSLTMVRLAEPARFTQDIQPIPLPSRCPQPGETCYVSGWGSIPNKYKPSQHLKCLTVPVVDDQTCMNTFPEVLHWNTNMVCAGQANTDNCMYDGGSVMVCDGQLQGLQWFNNGCINPADPTVYTKLCKYNDWINYVMDQYAPTETTPGKMT
ncbi:trypsinogen-like protein 3 [Micropterus salmoides]|uniref:trypsinogen-like protein 3 n=1 Tax=Micropterus salmoides TaxID=27706 RepID=UPI0018ECB0D3|nr:trypsinogen-like protein 3 [Micropterus salmoides]